MCSFFVCLYLVRKQISKFSCVSTSDGADGEVTANAEWALNFIVAHYHQQSRRILCIVESSLTEK